MRRAQIQLDEDLYTALRRRAYEQGRSMAAVVRDVLADALIPPKRMRSLDDFDFIGSGRSHQNPGHPVSEHHDEALANAIKAPDRRTR